MNKIIAVIGMCGSGKSETVKFFEEHGYKKVYFGEVVMNEMKRLGLEVNETNERQTRENLRKEFGMAAYAIKSKAKIDELIKAHNAVVLDGLYSWEEYVYLKKEFPTLTLIHIYAEPQKRYERLSHRKVRPIPLEKCYERDITEIENLNKGGPIAIADYLIENNEDDLEVLHKKIDLLLTRLEIQSQ